MPDQRDRRIEALEQRISSLSAAVLRINESLDLPTVLREVTEVACALTATTHGVIATTNANGKVLEYVSVGFTDEEHRGMAEWPEGPRLFARMRDVPAPLKLANLAEWVREQDFATDLLPPAAVMGMPLRHRGRHVGNFFVGMKSNGEEFTAADEEILALFASQAATAIANARTHRAEQRARADLEALIDTSPVGVAVLDASTGAALSVNREAKRIVESLRTPGMPVEHLLEMMTCQLADGREIDLNQFQLAHELTSAETMRAEEIVLSLPDGRSVSALVNVTPIRTGKDAIGSVVVTLQDLAPIEALDRMRSEFLGMVGHELRTPLAAIKGSTTAVLGGVRNFAPAETHAFFRIVDEQADRMIGLVADLLDAGRIDSGTLSVSPEPTEVAALVEGARTAFLSGGGRHTVTVDLPADLPWVTADRERIAQVLGNLLANASRQAPESSPIRIAAERDGVYVAVSVTDEGRGIARERLAHLFRRYAGMGDGEREAGGSGLGLSICKGLVEAHGGRIRAESAGPGQGARFTFTLPAAAAAAPAAPSAPDGPSPQGETERVLVLDDDPQTLRHVRDALAGSGYAPLVSADYRELAQIIRTESPDLVLLDLVLPGADGIELMQTLPELARQPVIFISAYGRDETVARALEAGAADYIVKPFSPTELVARIRAALRRRADPEPFVLGDLAIDYDRRRVTVAGRAVELTPTEYELLRALSLDAGRVVTYEFLLERVWSERSKGDWKVVRAFVKQLRAKLGDEAANPTWIFNVRGVGYRMPQPNGAGES